MKALDNLGCYSHQKLHDLVKAHGFAPLHYLSRCSDVEAQRVLPRETLGHTVGPHCEPHCQLSHWEASL